MQKKIKSFTDLHTWQEGHRLVLMIYKKTEIFSSKNIFNLVNQMCRAAISIISNIAEGFSRNTAKEKYQFYSVAQGSVAELQNRLLISCDERCLSKEKFSKIANQIITVNKLICGLKCIKNTKS